MTDAAKTQAPSVLLGLSNPKSPSNVGAVMRAAGCFGVQAVYYTGQRYARAAKFQTDTQQAQNHIALEGLVELLAAKTQGHKLVCVELVEGAQALPEFEHPERAYYVFGPEDGSLSQDLVDAADAVVYVPTTGCLNLAATVNVLLYDRLAKSSYTAGDDVIRANRDRNNRLSA